MGSRIERLPQPQQIQINSRIEIVRTMDGQVIVNRQGQAQVDLVAALGMMSVADLIIKRDLMPTAPSRPPSRLCMPDGSAPPLEAPAGESINGEPHAQE